MPQHGRSYKVSLINPNEVDAIFPHVVKHLKRAVVYADGELETEDFLPMLLDGEMQLWLQWATVSAWRR